MLDEITPLVLTFNEAPNIGRTLEKLRWAKRIVVVDSGSTDETPEIVRRFPQAEMIPHAFKSFAGQCNFGLSQTDTNWVLSLDADYELSDELINEIDGLRDTNVNGYRASFIYRVYGQPLRGTLYPQRTILYRRRSAKYEDFGHGHRVLVQGEIRQLCGVVYHDDRKALSHWLRSQREYAALEADYILLARRENLSLADRIRSAAWIAPWLVPMYVLFAKGCILDGWAGWYYALQRLLAETLLALELIDRRLKEVLSKAC